MFRPLSRRPAPFPVLSSAAVIHRWSTTLIPKFPRFSRRYPNHPLYFLPPDAARAPHHFSEHHALRESCVLHARHKSREQDHPPPAHNHLDNTLSSRIHERGVQIGNRVVGAIVPSSTDAPSQQAVMGSAQRVVLERARAPRSTWCSCTALS